MEIKAVFIDIDNTLLDFDGYVRQTMKSGFEIFSLKRYEPYMYDVFTRINNALWKEIERRELTFAELENVRWNKIFEALGIDFDGKVFEDYFRKALNESAIPENGAYELLKYLSEKYIVCAASNGPFLQQMHRLELADMAKYFDYIFISEQVGVSKPSHEFFDYAFSHLNGKNGRSGKSILPHETIIIGDSLSSDIAGGKECGMKTCYYNKNRCSVSPEIADFVVSELADITEFL